MINIFKVQRTISELPRPGCRESLGGGQKWFSQYCFMGKCHKGKHFFQLGNFFHSNLSGLSGCLSGGLKMQAGLPHGSPACKNMSARYILSYLRYTSYHYTCDRAEGEGEDGRGEYLNGSGPDAEAAAYSFAENGAQP